MFNIGGISFMRRTLDKVYKNQVLFKNKHVDACFLGIKSMVESLKSKLEESFLDS